MKRVIKARRFRTLKRRLPYLFLFTILIINLVWFVAEPGFEPLVGLLSSALALLVAL